MSGPRFRRYGGATTCFEIDMSPSHRLLVDMGTGALSIHDDLPAEGALWFSVLLTHLHWDHTLAIPFFMPLYHPANRFDFYGHPALGLSIDNAIDWVMRPPWFPTTFKGTPAEKRYHHLDGEPVMIGDVEVRNARLHHPDGVTSYRMSRDGVTVVVATDVEHGDTESDEELLELAAGADLLFYDAQYLPEEHETSRAGWGHSTWKAAVELAKAANVGRLVLTSHDPSRTDDQVDMILEMAQAEFPDTEAAAEGMKIQVG